MLGFFCCFFPFLVWYFMSWSITLLHAKEMSSVYHSVEPMGVLFLFYNCFIDIFQIWSLSKCVVSGHQAVVFSKCHWSTSSSKCNSSYRIFNLWNRGNNFWYQFTSTYISNDSVSAQVHYFFYSIIFSQLNLLSVNFV